VMSFSAITVEVLRKKIPEIIIRNSFRLCFI
jgi:hypothetical protein